MTTYYVDATLGLDSNPGTAASPFQTTDALSNLMVAGDIANILPGTYTKRIQINASGTAGNPIWVRGDPDSVAFPTIASDNTNGILVSSRNHQRFSRLDITTPSATPSDLISIDSGDTIIIEDCSAVGASGGNGRGIRVQGTSPNLIVRNCKIADAINDGISLAGTCANFLVERCWIENIGDTGYGTGGTGDGLTAHDSCAGTFRKNYIRRCSNRGIGNVQRTGSTIVCDGNFVADCMRVGISGGFDAVSLGTHVFTNNVVLMSDVAAVTGGQPLGIRFGGTAAAQVTYTAYHNLVINPINNGGAYSYSGEGLTDDVVLTFKNNASICLNTTSGRHWNFPNVALWITTNGSVLSNNSYSLNTGVRFLWRLAGAGASSGLLADFAAPVTGTGQEANSIATAQQFVNAPADNYSPGAYVWTTDANRWPAGRNAADFCLKTTSPLKATGALLTGLATDPWFSDIRGRIRGATPDMGPFQFFTLQEEDTE